MLSGLLSIGQMLGKHYPIADVIGFLLYQFIQTGSCLFPSRRCGADNAVIRQPQVASGRALGKERTHPGGGLHVPADPGKKLYLRHLHAIAAGDAQRLFKLRGGRMIGVCRLEPLQQSCCRIDIFSADFEQAEHVQSLRMIRFGFQQLCQFRAFALGIVPALPVACARQQPF